MNFLTEYQHDILNQALQKKNGSLHLPMGSGKTLISLVLSQILAGDNKILIVVSKTLISNWISEIAKFCPELQYTILHQHYIRDLDSYLLPDSVKLVLTTPQVTSKYYKINNLEDLAITKVIVNQGLFNQHVINYYNKIHDPIINKTSNLGAGNILYTIRWGCLIIDEIQNYTNALVDKCKSLTSICATYKWGLSGTLFNEPSVQRILGYSLLVNDYTFPRTIPDAQRWIMSNVYSGYRNTTITGNPESLNINLKKHYIGHNLSEPEVQIYTSLKRILQELNKRHKQALREGNNENQRTFSAYMLTMVTYLRQCLVAPLLPITKLMLDVLDLSKRNEVVLFINDQLRQLNLGNYFDSIESVKSSRIQSALNVLSTKLQSENVIVFCSFRKCLEIFREMLPENRKVYTLESSMSIQKRSQVLDSFGKETNAILLLTFKIGSEGLNLQYNTKSMLLLDYEWNDGITQQAIARIYRRGQISQTVGIYFFTSNTLIERLIFEKQVGKLKICNELAYGRQKSNVSSIKLRQIVNLLETSEENELLLKSIQAIKRH